MKANGLNRRLVALESNSGQDLVCVGHQWLNEDGTPASEWVERLVPRSRIQSLEKCLRRAMSTKGNLKKRIEAQEQQAEPVEVKLIWYDEGTRPWNRDYQIAMA